MDPVSAKILLQELTLGSLARSGGSQDKDNLRGWQGKDRGFCLFLLLAVAVISNHERRGSKEQSPRKRTAGNHYCVCVFVVLVCVCV